MIGDSRNDENLLVAQFHLAFLRFHNAAVDWVKSQNTYSSDDEVFAEAQKLTRLHYQWLVVNDYLPNVTAHGTVDKVLQGGRKFYNPMGEAFAPIEFSVAAYRFGHSMVRDTYDHNRNFGRGGAVKANGTFGEMFTFTGKGGFFGLETLPSTGSSSGTALSTRAAASMQPTVLRRRVSRARSIRIWRRRLPT